jgi:hypothetical protein
MPNAEQVERIQEEYLALVPVMDERMRRQRLSPARGPEQTVRQSQDAPDATLTHSRLYHATTSYYLLRSESKSDRRKEAAGNSVTKTNEGV